MNNSLISKSFKNSSAKTNKPKMLPFSLRFTADEKAYLMECAGNQSLAAYIRSLVLGERQEKRKITSRKPSTDQQALVRLLSALGQSRMPQNLNQIAKAAKQGELMVSRALVAELNQACADIRAMRSDLITALGLKSED